MKRVIAYNHKSHKLNQLYARLNFSITNATAPRDNSFEKCVILNNIQNPMKNCDRIAEAGKAGKIYDKDCVCHRSLDCVIPAAEADGRVTTIAGKATASQTRTLIP